MLSSYKKKIIKMQYKKLTCFPIAYQIYDDILLSCFGRIRRVQDVGDEDDNRAPDDVKPEEGNIGK